MSRRGAGPRDSDTPTNVEHDTTRMKSVSKKETSLEWLF